MSSDPNCTVYIGNHSPTAIIRLSLLQRSQLIILILLLSVSINLLIHESR
ncbi:hypothetical protein HanOQP8_Chr02g0045161 [Helianthus annuus]|nr:hypothetical protein HanOQP8_Chr02g0045161 [Helianthus annuus]